MELDLSLKGKHALVCGASSGIGRATALGLAAQGASLTVAARRGALLDALLPELLEAGAEAAQAVVVDFDEGPSGTARLLEIAHGMSPLQILVNNAGGPGAGPLIGAPNEAFIQGFQRHVLTSQRLVQGCLEAMTQAGYGRIINIISTSVREPIPQLGVSNTIRGAMAGWSKTLARELGPNITVNNVLPGFTDTERLDALREGKAQQSGLSAEEVNQRWLADVPEGRLARPEEIAAAVVFLASPAAGFIRGVNLPVDGGRMRCI